MVRRTEVLGPNQWNNAMAPRRGDPMNSIRQFPICLIVEVIQALLYTQSNPLNPNQPNRVEGYGREEQYGVYGAYDNAYLREERVRGRHGDLVRKVRDDHQNQDLDINSIKVSLPIFKGESDAKAYLAWESLCDKIFQLNDLTKDKKNCFAIAHFEGYANTWWEYVK
ncbi:hypothetical protein FXO37_35478 [Capsicum annuum]|nr:hypothetical protein FXO37_35478 [Capsicum annuum]